MFFLQLLDTTCNPVLTKPKPKPKEEPPKDDGKNGAADKKDEKKAGDGDSPKVSDIFF